MARAATAPELALFRSEGQWSQLFMAVLIPHTIYTARLASLPTSNDQVYEISHNTDSGTLSDVKAGMLLYVGTTAGAYDLGMCRIRTAPDASKFYIGETSEIDWLNNANCHLTIVDDFDIHPRHAKVDANGELFMDVNIDYSDQHTNFDPVPVLGSHAVVWLTGATINVSFDASNSWVFDSTITGYSWSAPGASSTSGMTSATPTITYNAAGVYRIYCTVTAANGKTAVGVRYVFVYNDANPPATVFQLANCEGSMDAGGWTFDITMQDEVSLSEIRERTLVILFAKDYYQGTEQSIGPITGRENIIAMGRIGPQEQIRRDPVAGQVHFSVYGPYYWLSKIKTSACQLEFSSVPADWGQMKDMTVDRVLWHLLHWRSTATMVMDVYPTLDTCLDDKAVTLANFLWGQLNEIAWTKLMARVLCDRYGRLFIEIDPQMIPAASRSSFPTVMTVTEDDWMDVIDFERATAWDTGQVSTSTRQVNSSGVGITLYSLSPGHMPRKYGDWEISDGVLTTSQAISNQKAGLLLGWKNNPYPEIPLKLASNNRMIDICPHQFLDFAVDAADTPRGNAYSGNLIPRRVSLTYDADAHWLSAVTHTEAETFEQPSCNGDVPGSRVDVSIPPLPGLPDLPIINPPILPGTIEPTPGGPPRVLTHDYSYGLLYSENFHLDDLDIRWRFVNAGIDPLHIPHIFDVMVTPGGAVYAPADIVGARWTVHLYRAPFIGGTFVEVVGTTWLAAHGQDKILGWGYNPFQPEQLAMLTASAGNASTLWIGSGSIWTQGSSYYPWNTDFICQISYGNGKWIVAQNAAASEFLLRYSADGTYEKRSDMYPQGYMTPPQHAGGSAKVFKILAGGQLAYSADNIEILETITISDGGISTLGLAPDGMYMMGAWTAANKGRSPDGGYSWEAIPNLLPGGAYGFAYVGGAGLDSHWLAHKGNIYYSENFGESWIQKNGNIASLCVTARNIHKMIVVG